MVAYAPSSEAMLPTISATAKSAFSPPGNVMSDENPSRIVILSSYPSFLMMVRADAAASLEASMAYTCLAPFLAAVSAKKANGPVPRSKTVWVFGSADFKRLMMAFSNNGVRDGSFTMAWYAVLSNETNFFSDSRLLRPSTEFHAADIDVVVESSAATATSGVNGSGSNVTNGVKATFWICSMAARRVEGAENASVFVMDASAMEHGSSSLLVRRAIMVVVDVLDFVLLTL
mmetsp:Transcript_38718/g.71278  ORF Transcript_38718/g.71278 Transcript_38718/m.71278 type:complete len:231 (+) Transcript_38718:203-895(+)